MNKTKNINLLALSIKPQNLKYKTLLGFTLVELIVVIVILAILATIAFLSFNSYSGKARDGNRLSNLKLTEKGLELSYISMGTYLMPEGNISTGTINGVDVAYNGYIGSNISNIIKLSTVPKDPITNDYIDYGLTADKTKYQLAITLEDSSSVSSSFNNNINIINKANADTQYIAKVVGTYIGNIRFSSGSTTKIHYLANIPSLIFNFSGSSTTDLLSGSTTYYVVNKNTNLPYKIANTTPINNKNGNTIIQEITNKTGATLTGINITTIVNATDSTTRTNLINSTFSGAMLDNFGGNINTVISAVNNGTTTTTTTIVKTWNGSGTNASPYIYKEDSTIIYPKSCNDILTSSTTAFNSSNTSTSVTYNGATTTKFKDGTYAINPTGTGSQINIYCDMTNDNGGRSLVVKSDNTTHAITRSSAAGGISGLDGPTTACSNGGDQKLSDTQITQIWSSSLRMTSQLCSYVAYGIDGTPLNNLKTRSPVTFSDQCANNSGFNWTYRGTDFYASYGNTHGYDCGWTAYINSGGGEGPYLFLTHESYKVLDGGGSGAGCGCGYGWVK